MLRCVNVSRTLLWIAVVATTCHVALADDRTQGIPLAKVPVLSDEEIAPHERGLLWGTRRQIGAYLSPPGQVKAEADYEVIYPPRDRKRNKPPLETSGNDYESMRVTYSWQGRGESFCGTYVIILADLRRFQTLTFQVRGASGGEAFEIAMHDLIANRREDAVRVGSIYRYLPRGVTTKWQEVHVPLEDFYGVKLGQAYGLILAINEPGSGAFWIDDVRFHTEMLVDRDAQINRAGHLLLDDFDHSDMNLLGRRALGFQQLPSTCIATRVKSPDGRAGRVLKLAYEKMASGWCGYYTMLNQIDGKHYDLSRFESMAFEIRGVDGGETFELAMADENWIRIGDSSRAGPIEQFLDGGVTQEWQTVTVPLAAFEGLDLTRMGSFSVVFNQPGQGGVYLDNIRFNLPRSGYRGHD